MEAAVSGKKSIALSFAFTSRHHDPVVIEEASKHSVQLIEYLHANWDDAVDVYTVNVPLEPGISKAKVVYTHMLHNKWSSGSCFEAIDASASGDEPGLQERNLREQSEGQLQNGGSSVSNKKTALQHKHFKWAPKLTDVYQSVEESKDGNDGWTVKEGMTRCVSEFSYPAISCR